MYDPTTIPHGGGSTVNAVYIDGHASSATDSFFKTLYPGLDTQWTRRDRGRGPIENTAREAQALNFLLLLRRPSLGVGLLLFAFSLRIAPPFSPIPKK